LGDRPGAAGASLGLATQLLDTPLDVASMSLGLAQVLLQPLLVRRARRHLDVRAERGLELLLLAVRLVQVLDQLGVALGHLVGHARSSGRLDKSIPRVAARE